MRGLNFLILFLFLLFIACSVPASSDRILPPSTPDRPDRNVFRGATEKMVSIVAGSGQPGLQNGPAMVARFDWPTGVAINRKGDRFIADYDNHVIRKIDRFGWVTTFAGQGIAGFSDGEEEARFYGPNGIAVDRDDNLYIADADNFRIRKITPEGIVSTVAGSGKEGNKEGPALEAEFVYPTGIAVAPDGSLYVADRGANRIKRVAAGMVMIVAGTGEAGYYDSLSYFAKFNNPTAVAFDDVENLYVADSGSHTIRRIDRQGVVTTVAGSGYPGYKEGLREAAEFSWPTAVVVDPEGNLIIADSKNHRIRKILLPQGRVSTLAGEGQPGFIDGAGGSARFDFPTGIAVDPTGGLTIADSGNHRIRAVLPNGLRVESPDF